MDIYICHRHETRFRKEMMRFGICIIFGLFGMDAGRCTDELWQFFCACTVVFLLINGADNCDIIR